MGGRGETRRYFFLHIPKTAGTALDLSLRQYHGDSVYPLPSNGALPPYREYILAYIDVKRLEASFRRLPNQIRLIIDEVLDTALTTFTVLRDPVERALSLLRRHKERNQNFADATLDEVYEDPYIFHGTIHNFMVRVLSMTVPEMRTGAWTTLPYDEARLERAKQNLEHRIEVFGVQEDFDRFCEQLSLRFGWDLGNIASVNLSAPVEASDALRQRIARDNAFDVELYRFAKELSG